MTTREKALDLMQRHAIGADAVDAVIAAAVEIVEARGTVRSELATSSCTLRDLFASKALEGLLAGHAALYCASDCQSTAEMAFKLADAMLAARKESPRAS